jgi:acid stress chaperone HdeB
MKRIAAALAVAALTFAMPARAQVVDLTTLTCKEFLASGKDAIGLLMLWVDGYFTSDSDPAVIDFGRLKSQGEELGAYCADHPDATMISAAEKIMTVDQPEVAQSAAPAKTRRAQPR